MKQNILKLRDEGKTYNEIVEILGCAKSTVAYHCSDSVRQNFKDYRNKNRKQTIRDIKISAGNKCVICGYDKCNTSLHFHHLDAKTKKGQVGELIYSKGKTAAIREAKKCILVCSNCHGEIHENLIDLSRFNHGVA